MEIRMREVKVTRQEMDESESENCVNSTRVEGNRKFDRRYDWRRERIGSRIRGFDKGQKEGGSNRLKV